MPFEGDLERGRVLLVLHAKACSSLAEKILRCWIPGWIAECRRLLQLKSAIVILALSATTQAATFVVNSTLDASDANPGNGICATSGGVCTLRAAIEESNNLAGTDT